MQTMPGQFLGKSDTSLAILQVYLKKNIFHQMQEKWSATTKRQHEEKNPKMNKK